MSRLERFKFFELILKILRTDHIGRLLIYADVMKSSSAILDKTKYMHGIAVVPRKLTAATGRGSNQV